MRYITIAIMLQYSYMMHGWKFSSPGRRFIQTWKI